MKQWIKDLPTYMIVVKGHKTSEGYADYVEPAWKAFGFKIQRFDAVTPDTLHKYDYLKFTRIQSAKYNRLGIKKDHTPTERGIWYSHTELWWKCIEANEPIVVMEHDVIPVTPSELYWNPHKEHYRVFDKGAMGCYVITPRFAECMIEMLTTPLHGITDSGPGSLVDWMATHEEWAKYRAVKGLHVVVHRMSEYRNACTQVIDRRYGTVIDHYTGTEAEGLRWGEFQHYREITLPDR